MTVHWFKGSFALLAVIAVFVDVAQIAYQADAAVRRRARSQAAVALAIAAQYILGALNVLALRYFFASAAFGTYLRRVLRHSLTVMFAVIFLFR